MALKREVESLQRQLQDKTDVLETIRNATDDEVLVLVHQLRLTDDLPAVLSSYQGRTGSAAQLSEYASAQAVTPSTETDIDFGLAMLHPTTYPVFVPPSPPSIVSASLIGGSTQTTSPSSTALSPSEPYAYCDPRLEILTVSYWTRIPIDDRLAARAISHFLQTDHPVLGFFDADLFLRDLVDQTLDFCSSFLFHSVMSLACVRLPATLLTNTF
jgi:hypothetical protein